MKTITVGCKLPHGILMELEGKVVKIAGANSSRIAGGFGMTENVDAQFFNEWMKRNADLTFVKSGLVFGFEKNDEAKAFAQLSTSVPTGFEKLNPAAMPKLLEPTEEQGRELKKRGIV